MPLLVSMQTVWWSSAENSIVEYKEASQKLLIV